jgi:hypothetical protein
VEQHEAVAWWADESRGEYISGGEYDEESCRYHLCIQFLLHEQLAFGIGPTSSCSVPRQRGSNLAGDVWCHREAS